MNKKQAIQKLRQSAESLVDARRQVTVETFEKVLGFFPDGYTEWGESIIWQEYIFSSVLTTCSVKLVVQVHYGDNIEIRGPQDVLDILENDYPIP